MQREERGKGERTGVERWLPLKNFLKSKLIWSYLTYREWVYFTRSQSERLLNLLGARLHVDLGRKWHGYPISL